MCVAGGRLDLRVAKQFADHRQGLAERQRPAGEAMSYIVYLSAFPSSAD